MLCSFLIIMILSFFPSSRFADSAIKIKKLLNQRFAMETVTARVQELYRFLEQHRALFDAHSVDFFLCDHWLNVIPPEWRSVVSQSHQLPADEDFLNPRNHSNAGTLNLVSLCYPSLRSSHALNIIIASPASTDNPIETI